MIRIMSNSIKDEKDVKELVSNEARSKGETIEGKNVMNEKEIEEKNNENSQVTGMNNFISKIFGGKGQQETDSLKKESESEEKVTYHQCPYLEEERNKQTYHQLLFL